MHDQKTNFYGPVGKKLRSWWVHIDKMGFDNDLDESGPAFDGQTLKDKRKSPGKEISFNSIQDPFVVGKIF